MKKLTRSLAYDVHLGHYLKIFISFIPRDWKQVKQVDTCLFHVICMLFLAVIISTVLHGVLKQGPILETHVIFHVFMCNLISL